MWSIEDDERWQDVNSKSWVVGHEEPVLKADVSLNSRKLQPTFGVCHQYPASVMMRKLINPKLSSCRTLKTSTHFLCPNLLSIFYSMFSCGNLVNRFCFLAHRWINFQINNLMKFFLSLSLTFNLFNENFNFLTFSFREFSCDFVQQASSSNWENGSTSEMVNITSFSFSFLYCFVNHSRLKKYWAWSVSERTQHF